MMRTTRTPSARSSSVAEQRKGEKTPEERRKARDKRLAKRKRH
jgi:hypothetical protein